ncbi:MAG: NUDIX hydrolase [Actinomycetota bacterium]
MADPVAESGDATDPLSPPIGEPIELDRYALSTVVYPARPDGDILLLQRSEGSALAGQFFPPGGVVDPGEDPWDAAERELFEESGLRPLGPLTMVGCYPMLVYGQQMLQLSFRCDVDGEVVLSHEHTDSLWIAPADMAAFLTPEARASIADGNEAVLTLLDRIAEDVDRYLAGLA